MRPPDFWVYAYLFGDELQLFARSTVLYPVKSSASSIMLKPKSQLCLKGYGCRSMPIPEQGNIFLYFIFASDFHLRKDIQPPTRLNLRLDSSEPGSVGKCNFGPVFGKLYTDGLTDTDAAASCPGNCVVQHQRETYQRSVITTYHHKKAQIRDKRGRRCTIAGIVIARIRTAVVDFTRTSSCPS